MCSVKRFTVEESIELLEFGSLFASRNQSCGAFHRIKPLYLIKRKINMISFCLGFEHIFVKIYIVTDDKIRFLNTSQKAHNITVHHCIIFQILFVDSMDFRGFMWDISGNVDILIDLKSLCKCFIFRIIFTKNPPELDDTVKIRVDSGSLSIKEKKFHKSDSG